MKNKCLIILDYYLPSKNSGGPLKSIQNLITSTHEKIDYTVLTRNHDIGSPTPYSETEIEGSRDFSEAKIEYLSDRQLNPISLYALTHKEDIRVVYLNSFFSSLSVSYLASQMFGRIKRHKIILAPRGEFSPGALKISKIKKNIYIKLFRIIAHRRITLNASNLLERQHIEKVLGRKFKIAVTSDIPTRAISTVEFREKLNSLQVVFISRLSSKKNLIGALEILREIEFPYEFTIYGPIEDADYWKKCENYIAEHNINAKYGGSLSEGEVRKAFESSDVFLFPTFGENYGHVIIESLSAGCPVITSAETPWEDLDDYNVGATIRQGVRKYAEALRNIFLLSSQERHEQRINCTIYADKKTSEQSNADLYVEMLGGHNAAKSIK